MSPCQGSQIDLPHIVRPELSAPGRRTEQQRRRQSRYRASSGCQLSSGHPIRTSPTSVCTIVHIVKRGGRRVRRGRLLQFPWRGGRDEGLRSMSRRTSGTTGTFSSCSRGGEGATGAFAPCRAGRAEGGDGPGRSKYPLVAPVAPSPPGSWRGSRRALLFAVITLNLLLLPRPQGVRQGSSSAVWSAPAKPALSARSTRDTERDDPCRTPPPRATTKPSL